MGTKVLDPGEQRDPKLRVYAQCLNRVPGGVSLEVLNIDREAGHTLSIPLEAERYTLTASSLLSDQVLLNGAPLTAGEDGSLPNLRPARQPLGGVLLPPASITFITFPRANNAACKK